MNELKSKKMELVLPTPLDEIMQHMQEEKRIHDNKERRIREEKLRRDNLVRSIASVYFFLKKEIGLPKRSLTVEEYIVIKNALTKRAQIAVNNWWCKFMRFCGLKTPWHYFLEFGYFSKHTPFGYWDRKISVLSIFWDAFSSNQIGDIFCDPATYEWTYGQEYFKQNIVPENLFELIKKLSVSDVS